MKVIAQALIHQLSSTQLITRAKHPFVRIDDPKSEHSYLMVLTAKNYKRTVTRNEGIVTFDF